MIIEKVHSKKYTTFDDRSYEKLLTTIRRMTAYSLDAPSTEKKLDIFFDSPDGLLYKYNLLLRKRIVGSKAKLNIMRVHDEEQYAYMDHLRSSQREQEIGVTDPLSKHFFFLNNALNSMFTSALQFDPDKLFEQMQVIMTIDIAEEKRIILGFGGLKLELKYEMLKFQNKITNRKNAINIVKFTMLSPEETLPYFEDFVAKVERKFKEIFANKENKFELATRMTKPLPSKEETKKRLQELEKQKRLEKAGLTALKK